MMTANRSRLTLSPVSGSRLDQNRLPSTGRLPYALAIVVSVFIFHSRVVLAQDSQPTKAHTAQGQIQARDGVWKQITWDPSALEFEVVSNGRTFDAKDIAKVYDRYNLNNSAVRKKPLTYDWSAYQSTMIDFIRFEDDAGQQYVAGVNLLYGLFFIEPMNIYELLESLEGLEKENSDRREIEIRIGVSSPVFAMLFPGTNRNYWYTRGDREQFLEFVRDSGFPDFHEWITSTEEASERIGVTIPMSIHEAEKQEIDPGLVASLAMQRQPTISVDDLVRAHVDEWRASEPIVKEPKADVPDRASYPEINVKDLELANYLRAIYEGDLDKFDSLIKRRNVTFTLQGIFTSYVVAYMSEHRACLNLENSVLLSYVQTLGTVRHPIEVDLSYIVKKTLAEKFDEYVLDGHFPSVGDERVAPIFGIPNIPGNLREFVARYDCDSQVLQRFEDGLIEGTKRPIAYGDFR